jgi:hypothetical protein
MMDKPGIFADFHNADEKGRLRLNCVGTMEELAVDQVGAMDVLAAA